ncbi:phenazine biosynthesis protein-like protein phzf family [Microthyrium microscopicum]|uniref:Phenazine biosynthesis protein-like protein phzf family n=1 Tax=Microthyrium microscopicum TaxID=703497 RepID=A0A6A6U8F7_9PEZI|nr:phenazine biosynthesis protein-like protein phzf family [Microthyrium microscopicum]
MQLKFVTLDVFHTTRFLGNPLAIIHIPSNLNVSQEQKQKIAFEFNLSESVFLHEQTPDDIKARQVRIDIFTRNAEIPFAGHPTIGTANYLAHDLKNNGANTLITKAGPIPITALADPTGDSKGVAINLAHDVHIHAAPYAHTPYGNYPVVSIVNGMTFILVKVDSNEVLGAKKSGGIKMDREEAVQHLDEGWRYGLVGTYFYVDGGKDSSGARMLRTRMFGTADDSAEDPATGSAASALCSYLTLTEKSPPTSYVLNQGVEMGRSSFIAVKVTASDDHESIKEVILSGSAVKVMSGSIEV